MIINAKFMSIIQKLIQKTKNGEIKWSPRPITSSSHDEYIFEKFTVKRSAEVRFDLTGKRIGYIEVELMYGTVPISKDWSQIFPLWQVITQEKEKQLKFRKESDLAELNQWDLEN